MLQSPDFDQDGYYDHNMNCKWTIVTEPGFVILLRTTEEKFDVEHSERWCLYYGITHVKCLLAPIRCRFDRIKVGTRYILVT